MMVVSVTDVMATAETSASAGAEDSIPSVEIRMPATKPWPDPMVAVATFAATDTADGEASSAPMTYGSWTYQIRRGLSDVGFGRTEIPPEWMGGTDPPKARPPAGAGADRHR